MDKPNSPPDKRTGYRLTLSTMAIVLLVGFLIWGRLQLKRVPRTAVAEPKKMQKTRLAPVTPVVDPGTPSHPSSEDREKNPIDPEKSSLKPTDESQVAAETALSALTLQTVFPGDPPSAVINGQSLTPGDEIQGFVLRRVMPNQVALEKNGVEIRLIAD